MSTRTASLTISAVWTAAFCTITKHILQWTHSYSRFFYLILVFFIGRQPRSISEKGIFMYTLNDNFFYSVVAETSALCAKKETIKLCVKSGNVSWIPLTTHLRSCFTFWATVCLSEWHRPLFSFLPFTSNLSPVSSAAAHATEALTRTCQTRLEQRVALTTCGNLSSRARPELPESRASAQSSAETVWGNWSLLTQCLKDGVAQARPTPRGACTKPRLLCTV